MDLPFKAEVKTFITLSDYEFEMFIMKHYNVKDFSFVADQESGNDESHDFRVDKEDLDEWETKDLNKFKSTGRASFISHTLLKDLANEGIIPEGQYLIQVSW